MNILVLTINYWPEQTGIGAVVTRRCEYLAALGHEVTVCTGMPYYPEWRIGADYKRKVFSSEMRNGVNIRRSWLWVPKKLTSAKRVVFEASFIATSFMRALQSVSPDVLVVVSPPLGLGLTGWMLSRWLKIPYLFDVQDLQPDAAADLGMLPGPILPFLFGIESLAYKNAALISTVTEGMKQKIVAKGISASKVVVVPPPAETDLFGVGSLVGGDEFRAKHNLEGKFLIVHSGNMGVKQGLDLVLDTAARLKERSELFFLLAGDGAMKANLERRATDMRLSNILFLPLQDQSEFLQMLAAVDLALIVQKASVSDIVFPSKAVTLLSAARPVGAAVSESSEIARVIRSSGAGIVTPPGEPESLAQTICHLIQNGDKGKAMGQSGRKYALEHWNQHRVLKNFEAHLFDMSGMPRVTSPELPAAPA